MVQPVGQPQPAQQPPPAPGTVPTGAKSMEEVLAEMPGGGQGTDPEDDELFAQYNTQLQVVKEEE